MLDSDVMVALIESAQAVANMAEGGLRTYEKAFKKGAIAFLSSMYKHAAESVGASGDTNGDDT